MTSSEMHEVDPEGDTLLVLQHSDTPFAMCDPEEMWPNSLPDYQSDESKKQEATLISSDVSEDVDKIPSSTSPSLQPKPEKIEHRFRLCSHILKRTCLFFTGLMSSQWQEATSEPGYKWTVKANDWDHEAVLILMDILHHNIKAVPRTITLEMLTKISVIVDYYGGHQAVEHWAETWIANLALKMPEHYSRDLLLRLTVATVFPDNRSFRLLTKVIIGASRGPFHTLGLPIPQQVVDTIESKRKQTITDLVSSVQRIWEGLNLQPTASNRMCEYTRLGYFDQNLFIKGLKPLPNAPFFGISLIALTETLQSFERSTECPCGWEDHLFALRKEILECTQGALENYIDGLDLHQFQAKETAQNEPTPKRLCRRSQSSQK